MGDDVEPCSCDEALALRRELAEEVARHARLGRRHEETERALAIAENRIRELLPLRDAVGRLAKQVRQLKAENARDGEREADATAH